MSFQYTTEYYTSPYYTVIVKLYDGFIPQKTQTGLEDPGTPSLPVVDQPQLGPATEIIRTYIDQNDSGTITHECNQEVECNWNWNFVNEKPDSISISTFEDSLTASYDSSNFDVPINKIVYINKNYSKTITVEGPDAFEKLPSSDESPQIVLVESQLPNMQIHKFTASYGNNSKEYAVTILANYSIVRDKVIEKVNARRS